MSTPDLDNWFKAWSDLTSTAPWHASLDHWWRSMGEQTAGPHHEVFEKIVTQSKTFYRLAEELGKAADTSRTSTEWRSALDDVFAATKAGFEAQSGSANDFWGAPLEAWRRTVSDTSNTHGEQFNDKLKQFFSMPVVGYYREVQEQQQRYTRCLVDYQSAYKRYVAAYAEMSNLSLDRMRARLEERMEQEREPITTIRELYDLWVDCSEEVYGEYVMADDYATCHADLVNAQMRLTHQTSVMMDDFISHLNMPTRAEIDTLYVRFKAMQGQQQTLQNELHTVQHSNRDLVTEVQKLSRVVKKLKIKVPVEVKPKAVAKGANAGEIKKVRTKKKKKKVTISRGKA